jgi:predicted metal-dependent HD superfamily phosphohydrolase
MRTSLDHWLTLWHRLGGLVDAIDWHERLVKAYAEPQRAYHSLQHLDECLSVFDEAKAFMQQPDLIEMALWFHDAVYDPKSGENEALSAKMAVEAVRDTQAAREVARLIMLTKSHQPGDGLDDAWIIDIDLAIFAQVPERVMEYERQIRQEYTWVPDAVYREKRAEILTGFLNRERIYLTTWARERFEERARENLRTLIARLTPISRAELACEIQAAVALTQA